MKYTVHMVKKAYFDFYIEVEAESEATALTIAEEKFYSLPDKDWEERDVHLLDSYIREKN